VTEAHTFFRNAEGKAIVIWTANKGGGASIMKVEPIGLIAATFLISECQQCAALLQIGITSRNFIALLQIVSGTQKLNVFRFQ
jgi:hypothetical protein